MVDMGSKLNDVSIPKDEEIEFIDVKYFGFNEVVGIHEFICGYGYVYAITDTDLKYDGVLVYGDWVSLYEDEGAELGYKMVPF